MEMLCQFYASKLRLSSVPVWRTNSRFNEPGPLPIMGPTTFYRKIDKNIAGRSTPKIGGSKIGQVARIRQLAPGNAKEDGRSAMCTTSNSFQPITEDWPLARGLEMRQCHGDPHERQQIRCRKLQTSVTHKSNGDEDVGVLQHPVFLTPSCWRLLQAAAPMLAAVRSM